MRVCAGCQELKSKKEMIRVVRTPKVRSKSIRTGKKSGRGVYLCPDSECLEKAYKEHRLERSLKTKVSNDIYEALRKDLL